MSHVIDPRLIPMIDGNHRPQFNPALQIFVPLFMKLSVAPAIVLVIANGSFQWSGGGGGSALTQGRGPVYASNAGSTPYQWKKKKK